MTKSIYALYIFFLVLCISGVALANELNGLNSGHLNFDNVGLRMEIVLSDAYELVIFDSTGARCDDLGNFNAPWGGGILCAYQFPNGPPYPPEPPATDYWYEGTWRTVWVSNFQFPNTCNTYDECLVDQYFMSVGPTLVLTNPATASTTVATSTLGSSDDKAIDVVFYGFAMFLFTFWGAYKTMRHV